MEPRDETTTTNCEATVFRNNTKQSKAGVQHSGVSKVRRKVCHSVSGSLCYLLPSIRLFRHQLVLPMSFGVPERLENVSSMIEFIHEKPPIDDFMSFFRFIWLSGLLMSMQSWRPSGRRLDEQLSNQPQSGSFEPKSTVHFNQVKFASVDMENVIQCKRQTVRVPREMSCILVEYQPQ